MSKKRAGLLSAAVLAALSGASMDASAAAYIGVNFVGGSNGGAPTSMLADDIAGVVPQGNWNNVTGQTGSAVALNDASGAATPVTLTFAGAGTWGTGVGIDTPNRRLMNGYVDGTDNGSNTYTFNNVPAGVYNLIVYSLADNTDDGRDQSVTVNGNVAGRLFSSSEPGANFNNNGFVRATATTQDGPGAVGNYLQFDNISPVAGTITIVGQSLNFRNFANGIQLDTVVPEPGTLGLAAVGAVGMLARRRRNA